VLGLGADWSRAEYSGAGRNCGTGAPGVARARLPVLKRLPRRGAGLKGQKGGWIAYFRGHPRYPRHT